jgi:hypothetical protein
MRAKMNNIRIIRIQSKTVETEPEMKRRETILKIGDCALIAQKKIQLSLEEL